MKLLTNEELVNLYGGGKMYIKPIWSHNSHYCSIGCRIARIVYKYFKRK